MREVRVIGEEGEQLGVLPTFEALRLAREKSLDLVEVAPLAVPPVCRLLDYGKYKYEQTKKEREARKTQKVTLLKEVRLTPKTKEHDIETKMKAIHRFLEDGDKVKVTIRFRGRELAHPMLGRDVLDQVVKALQGHAAVERTPLMEGKAMTMILTPARGASGQPAQPPAPAPQAERPAASGDRAPVAPAAPRPAAAAPRATPGSATRPATGASRPAAGASRPAASASGPAATKPTPRPAPQTAAR